MAGSKLLMGVSLWLLQPANSLIAASFSSTVESLRCSFASHQTLVSRIAVSKRIDETRKGAKIQLVDTKGKRLFKLRYFISLVEEKHTNQAWLTGEWMQRCATKSVCRSTRVRARASGRRLDSNEGSFRHYFAEKECRCNRCSYTVRRTSIQILPLCSIWLLGEHFVRLFYR